MTQVESISHRNRLPLELSLQLNRAKTKDGSVALSILNFEPWSEMFVLSSSFSCPPTLFHFQPPPLSGNPVHPWMGEWIKGCIFCHLFLGSLFVPWVVEARQDTRALNLLKYWQTHLGCCIKHWELNCVCFKPVVRFNSLSHHINAIECLLCGHVVHTS